MALNAVAGPVGVVGGGLTDVEGVVGVAHGDGGVTRSTTLSPSNHGVQAIGALNEESITALEVGGVNVLSDAGTGSTEDGVGLHHSGDLLVVVEEIHVGSEGVRGQRSLSETGHENDGLNKVIDAVEERLVEAHHRDAVVVDVPHGGGVHDGRRWEVDLDLPHLIPVDALELDSTQEGDHQVVSAQKGLLVRSVDRDGDLA